MNVMVYYFRVKKKFLLVEGIDGSYFVMRALTDGGIPTGSTFKISKDTKGLVRVPNCTLFRRVKFSKTIVDRLAFLDFVDFLNTEMRDLIVKVRGTGDEDEALAQIGRVLFAIFHLTKKEGVEFELDDVLGKMKTKLMQVACKKSMVQYLVTRTSDIKIMPMSYERLLKEAELSKVVMSFSKEHKPIMKAASNHLSYVLERMREEIK